MLQCFTAAAPPTKYKEILKYGREYCAYAGLCGSDIPSFTLQAVGCDSLSGRSSHLVPLMALISWLWWALVFWRKTSIWTINFTKVL